MNGVKIDQKKDFLLIVDVQNGFLPKGNLAIANGDEIIPVINRLVPLFNNVVVTQDWHPQGHLSFASSHAGKQAGETIKLAYGEQVLWPDHCVQGTHDAEIAADLQADCAQMIIRKGYIKEVDSYSAFMEADRKTMTGLAGYLKERGLSHGYICGLATDFCVAWSALDAIDLGFSATVIEDACKGIDLNGSLKQAWLQMNQKGIKKISSSDLL